jgi:parallel beta helix pectate lyase-like protein
MRLAAFLYLAALVLPVPVNSATIRVPTDQPTIQEAINAAAASGDLILVEPGIYTGPLNRDLDFSGKAIVLRGIGGAAATIIDCQQLSRGFNFHSGETNAAVVEGFTVMNGRRPGDQRGGGILCVDASSPTIQNCIITRNEASNGSGMHCDRSSPIVSNCTMSFNGIGGVTIGDGSGMNCVNNSSPIITGCTFSNNVIFLGGGGAGVSCDASYLTITDCTFKDNDTEWGGGIAMDSGSSVVISRCTFEHNSAENYGDAILCFQSTFVATDCLFVGNVGAATMYTVSANVTLRNCTIALSHSPYSGGSVGVMLVDRTPSEPGIAVLDRVVVAFTDGIAVRCFGASVATLTCCDVFGNDRGDWTECIAGQAGINGNFSLDPQFCNLDMRDFRLHDTSPCLPGNHPQGDQCDLIGVYGSGCTTAVESTTWGAIKARF